MHFFLKSISKVDGNCTAILINSKKIDAMLLDLDSTACTALLAGVKTARSCSTSCQNWQFRIILFTVLALRKISGSASRTYIIINNIILIY